MLKPQHIFMCVTHTRSDRTDKQDLDCTHNLIPPPLFIFFLHNFYKSLPIAILLIYQFHCHFYTDESTKWSKDVVKFFLSSHGAKQQKFL